MLAERSGSLASSDAATGLDSRRLPERLRIAGGWQKHDAANGGRQSAEGFNLKHARGKNGSVYFLIGYSKVHFQLECMPQEMALVHEVLHDFLHGWFREVDQQESEVYSALLEPAATRCMRRTLASLSVVVAHWRKSSAR